jgi:hypothetical protein
VDGEAARDAEGVSSSSLSSKVCGRYPKVGEVARDGDAGRDELP